jgi:hypothetical protein
MRILATQGYFDDSCEGRLLEVDLDRGDVTTRLRFIPPAPLRVPAKGFTGACWLGAPGTSTLAICCHAALLLVDPPSWQVRELWHQPCMNDLHHVSVLDDRVYLVNTGLEAVDVFSVEGRFLASHALHPGWISASRQNGRTIPRDELGDRLDVRWAPGALRATRPAEQEPTLEPAITHAAAETVDHAVGVGSYYGPDGHEPFHRRKLRDYFHPNHVRPTGRQLLVTRLLDRSVWDLFSLRPVIESTPGLPHDGLIDGDRFWITCVNGLVVAYAMEHGMLTDREVERLDVFAETGHTGWCRGLWVTPEYIVVGLTEIREGRMPRHRWCDRPFADTNTSVLCLDRASRRLVSRVDLTDPLRHSKIFALLPCG